MEKYSEKIKYPELAEELKRRFKGDQAAIFDRDEEKFKKLNKVNAEFMKEIIEKYGWPTISKVGREGSETAWVLVQHSDHDREFQKQCLELMKQEAEGEVSKHNIASLTDRIRMNADLPQIYGSQVTGELGKEEPYPIENPETVDERRKEMGLIPLQDYLKFIREANKRLVERRQKAKS